MHSVNVLYRWLFLYVMLCWSPWVIGQGFDAKPYQLEEETLLPPPFHNPNNQEPLESLLSWFSRRIEPEENNIFVKSIEAGDAEKTASLNVYYHLHIRIHNNPKESVNEYEREQKVNIDELEKNIKETMVSLNASGEKIQVAFIGMFTMYDCDMESFGCFMKEEGRLPVGVQVEPVQVDVYHPFHEVWESEDMQHTNDSGRSYAVIGYNMIKYNGARPFYILLHELNHILFGLRDAYFESEEVFAKYGRGVACIIDAKNLSSLNVCKNALPITPLEIYLGLRGRGYKVPGWEPYITSLRQSDDTIADGVD